MLWVEMCRCCVPLLCAAAVDVLCVVCGVLQLWMHAVWICAVCGVRCAVCCVRCVVCVRPLNVYCVCATYVCDVADRGTTPTVLGSGQAQQSARLGAGCSEPMLSQTQPIPTWARIQRRGGWLRTLRMQG